VKSAIAKIQSNSESSAIVFSLINFGDIAEAEFFSSLCSYLSFYSLGDNFSLLQNCLTEH
jgi:hypothetical protein